MKYILSNINRSTYSKSGKCAGIYIVPHIEGGVQGLKVGYHCGGDLLMNDEFLISEESKKLLEILPHENKTLQAIRSDEPNEFLLEKTNNFIKEHFPGLHPDPVAHIRFVSPRRF